MATEFNLLRSFPKVKRGGIGRETALGVVKPEIVAVSRKEGFDYYDGDRRYGFGGYVYDGRWRKVAELAKERYNLNKNSKVLIDRTEKGFLVYDLKKLIPGITVYGIHRSEYPLQHAMDGFGKYSMIHDKTNCISPKIVEEEAKKEIEPFLLKAITTELPFKDNYFDTIISINSVLNYPIEECKQAIREIMRVGKDNGRKSYIHVDTWRNQQEKDSMMKWVLLSDTLLDAQEWKGLFEEIGYEGDYGFIIFDEDNF